jgi:hypothetical protein
VVDAGLAALPAADRRAIVRALPALDRLAGAIGGETA